MKRTKHPMIAKNIFGIKCSPIPPKDQRRNIIIILNIDIATISELVDWCSIVYTRSRKLTISPMKKYQRYSTFIVVATIIINDSIPVIISNSLLVIVILYGYFSLRYIKKIAMSIG